VAGALAQTVGDAVERDPGERRVGVGGPAGAHEELLEGGTGLIGELAEVLVGSGNVAPAEDAESLGAGDLLDPCLLLTTLARIARQEGEPCGVLPHRRQFEADHGAEECIGHLRQDAGAVSGARIRADGSAVLQVAQGLEGQRDDVVPGFAAQCRDHGEAAGVFLKRRVVHALLRGVCAGGAVRGLEVHQLPSSDLRVKPGDDVGPLVQCNGSPATRRRYREPSSLVGAVLVAVAPAVTSSVGGSLTSTKSDGLFCDCTSASASVRSRPGWYGEGSRPG
jgi:hypothetical protein